MSAEVQRIGAGRVFECRRCGDDVIVYELPVPFVDPDRFTCLACLDERHKPVQLALAVEKRKAPTRVEDRRYDPAQSTIPF